MRLSEVDSLGLMRARYAVNVCARVANNVVLCRVGGRGWGQGRCGCQRMMRLSGNVDFFEVVEVASGLRFCRCWAG